MAEQMDNHEATKRELQSTKRELQTTKRELESTKRELQSTKRIKDTATEYWDFGAPGDYTVMIDGKEVEITAASCIRVLDHGELNILTDKGRCFCSLRATGRESNPSSLFPKRSRAKPRNSSMPCCSKVGRKLLNHRPYELKAAQ